VALVGLTVFQYAVIQKQSQRIKRLEWRNRFVAEEQSYVTRSIVEYASVAGSTPARIAEIYYPMVMQVGEEICVSLNIEPPGVGGIPVYCYDAVTTEPTRHWDQVD
jgi:hypothetical protein